VSAPTEELWRTGRKVGRTLYRTPLDAPDGDGELIGCLDTREAATLAAAAPEMYRLLDSVRMLGYVSGVTDPELAARIDALLDKARGR
jgi:hypothetical protein